MSILTLAQYDASYKQYLLWQQSGGHTSQSINRWVTGWDATGTPSGGSLSIGNTANGLVPDSTTAGAPSIQGWGSNKGYLTGVEIVGRAGSSGGDGRMYLYDRLFHAGSYSFNANTSLSSQPSFSTRVPNSDYSGLQIWIEAATAFIGTPAITITYTNQAGSVGSSTGSINAPFTPGAGAMWQMPLAAGDCGVQKIESVVCATATAGTFNVLVVRPLFSAFVPCGSTSGPKLQAVRYPLELIGMPQMYSTSCLAWFTIVSGNLSVSTFDAYVEIASG
jgi:hypothetical protein